MPKKPTSLAALTANRKPAETIVTATEKPETKETKTIRQSLYLPEAVHEQLRALAFHERKKQHDLLMLGLDLVFKQYGQKSIAELTEGEK